MHQIARRFRPLLRPLSGSLVGLALAAYLLLPAFVVAHVAFGHGGHVSVDDNDDRPVSAGHPHAAHCDLCLALHALGHSGEPPAAPAAAVVPDRPPIFLAISGDQVQQLCSVPAEAFPRAPPLV